MDPITHGFTLSFRSCTRFLGRSINLVVYMVCIAASRTPDGDIVDTFGSRSLRGLLRGRFVGSFDEFAVFETCSGSDEGDEVGRVDRTPTVLGGFDELEGHRNPGGAGAGALGDPLTQPDGGEGGLDWICSAQMDPVLGRIVVEREQLLEAIAWQLHYYNNKRIHSALHTKPSGLRRQV